MPAKRQSPIPFDFVLDYLCSQNPQVKRMFGCHAVYIEAKIIFILRDRTDFPEDNGVWLATTAEYHESLLREIPCLRSIQQFGLYPTDWQLIPVTADTFEQSVIYACELIRRGDKRIGKYPGLKKKKN